MGYGEKRTIQYHPIHHRKLDALGFVVNSMKGSNHKEVRTKPLYHPLEKHFQN